MAKPKSIIEKFSETVKGLADNASQALKSEQPARIDEAAAAYMPLTAEGLVADPLLVPPIATQPAQRKKRTPNRTTRRRAAKAANKPAPKKSSRKTAKKSASARSKKIAKTAKRGGARKPTGKKGRP
jgi:hypothetical protein